MTPSARRDARPEPESPLVHVTPWGEMIEWRLPKLMGTAGLRFATELHAALLERGVTLTYGHVTTLIKRAPLRLNVDVQFALCDILACPPEALWERLGHVAVEHAPAETAKKRLKATKPIRARGLDSD